MLSELVDRVLESDDFISILREDTIPNVKTVKDMGKALEAYSKRLNACKVKTALKYDDEHLLWTVESPYKSITKRILGIESVDPKGVVTCDTNLQFPAPGEVNLNLLNNFNQMLDSIDRFVRDVERDAGKELSNTNSNTDTKSTDDKKSDDEPFELDPSVAKIMDDLGEKAEGYKNKLESFPTVTYYGKSYKPSGAKPFVSTEREAILSIEFPRDQEMEIYADTKQGKHLRELLSDDVKKYLGLGRKQRPLFRKDMNKNWYFYVPVGPVPVKNAAGPEAEALLNYFDGNKVRFQPMGEEM